MKYIISKHCYEQIKIRGISVEEVDLVLNKPDSIIKQDNSISVYQALSENKKYLFRIFVNIKKQPKIVVTAYKTSKTDKYENKI